jgi:crotonobetainyl-CoA:carnitine CoA-transferase CaiB-like acyl-CoA transferase
VLVGLSARSVERFGLGPDELAAANPDVVYVAMSAFGLDDRRPTPGFDAHAAVERGAMVTAPGHRYGPVFLGHPAVS